MNSESLDIATAARIAERLVTRHETVAVSESSSGGLISAALLSVSGASAFFLGAVVIYTARSREVLLGITPEQFQGLRSATEAAAALQAEAVRAQLGATWGLAETGAAGPAGNRFGDPAGHCCLAVSGGRRQSRTMTTGSAGRWTNMVAFTNAALSLLEASIA